MTAAVPRRAVLWGIVAAIAVGAGALAYWRLNACSNSVLARFPSADGKLEAVTFRRQCGAGVSTHVSVLRMGEDLPGEPGNIAAVDSNAGKAPAGPGGGPELRVTWWGSELRVWHHRQARLSPAASTNPAGVTVRHDVFD